MAISALETATTSTLMQKYMFPDAIGQPRPRGTFATEALSRQVLTGTIQQAALSEPECSALSLEPECTVKPMDDGAFCMQTQLQQQMDADPPRSQAETSPRVDPSADLEALLEAALANCSAETTQPNNNVNFTTASYVSATQTDYASRQQRAEAPESAGRGSYSVPRRSPPDDNQRYMQILADVLLRDAASSAPLPVHANAPPSSSLEPGQSIASTERAVHHRQTGQGEDFSAHRVSDNAAYRASLAGASQDPDEVDEIELQPDLAEAQADSIRRRNMTAEEKLEDRRRRNRIASSKSYYNRKRRIEQLGHTLEQERRKRERLIQRQQTLLMEGEMLRARIRQAEENNPSTSAGFFFGNPSQRR